MDHFTLAKTGMARSWVALSDLGLIARGPLAQGVFVMEFDLPLQAAVLLDHQFQDGIPRSFAVFYDPMAGLAVLHRQGARLVRHMLAGPLGLGAGLARLIFGFDHAAWTIRLQNGDHPERQSQGHDTLAFDAQELAAICACPRRHKAVQWFGFGRELPQSGAWIGGRTPVPTSLGMVEAARLRPGDVLMTLDGPLPLRAVQHLDLPARGSFAPVLLRAAFFGAGQDVLVAPDQQVQLSSGEVEYLFGVDSVLVRAGDLVDGRTALADDRRAAIRAVRLDLGRPALIDLGGLVLALGDDGISLNRYETATLMAMLRRQASRVA